MHQGTTDIWRPLWGNTSTQFSGATLEGNLDAEIAIVGAGLEGLALAGDLARRGKRTIVIEAETIGHGATGASAGIVAPQLVRQTPNDVAKRLGRAQADLYLRMLGSAGERTFGLIADRMKAVGASNAGFIAPAFGAGGAARVSATVSQWSPIRNNLTMLSAEETKAMTGAAGYAAAILDPTGGALNPVAYADMLASDAAAAGAQIYLRSPVVQVTRSGNGWHLRTAKGSVTARTAILCANGGNGGLARSLRHSVLPLAVCQMATWPLPDPLRRAILPHGHAMTDLENDVFSIRYDPAGRLITAYPMSERLREPGRLEDVINRRFSAALPEYRSIPLAYAWSGVAWLNSDLLPRVIAVDDGLFAVQACNGRGIALSAAIGQAFGHWLSEGGNGLCAIPIKRARSIPGFAVAQHFPALMMKAGMITQRARRLLSFSQADR